MRTVKIVGVSEQIRSCFKPALKLQKVDVKKRSNQAFFVCYRCNPYGHMNNKNGSYSVGSLW